MSAPAISRRGALLGIAGALTGGPLLAFGDAGAFHPRLLGVGGEPLTGPRATAPSHWTFELVRRTNAPGNASSPIVRADEAALLAEPFVIWAGTREFPELSPSEIRGLRTFLTLGGMMVVDDLEPERGVFQRSVRRELGRILPEHPVVKLEPSHVLYHSYYLLDRPIGRVVGPPTIDAVRRGKNAQVLLLAHDLLGALARSRADDWALAVVPGGYGQRERAVRFAVNIAMYLLCSDYKDDLVHASWLMRRRARSRP
ncbi:MAG: DUF4159 domain-containing protein [Polyangiaceae bacterium]|nr:DUF4159 domain-containing protein [Polyangiaceae bacterium]